MAGSQSTVELIAVRVSIADLKTVISVFIVSLKFWWG
jgi:hypothetical protein